MARFQNPRIERRADVARPYWFIRASVPHVQPDGSIIRRRTRIVLAHCDERKLTRSELERRKAAALAPVNDGRSMVVSQIRFRDLAEKYTDARLPLLSPAAQGRNRSLLETHLLPAFGDLRLCEIDAATIQAWLLTLDGLSWWTLHSLKGLLSSIFGAATKWRLWSGENPCNGVEIGRKTEKRARKRLSREDLQRFLAALPATRTCSVPVARQLAITAIVTGCRISELLGLQVGDVDGRAGVIEIRRKLYRGSLGAPKTEGSARRLHVGTLALDLLALASGRGHDAHIFVRPDGDLFDDRELQREVWRPAAIAAGIYVEGFGMRWFRRLGISLRQEAGATPIEAMRAAGHTRVDTTMLYTVTDGERQAAQSAAVLDAVMGEPKGRAS